MKKIIILLTISFLLCNCNSDKQKSQNSENEKSTTDTTATQIAKGDGQIISPGNKGHFDVTELDSSVWIEKGYSIENIADNVLVPVDEKTVSLFYDNAVLDSTRKYGEVEGEITTYDINYYYNTAYEFPDYYLLTLVEEIMDGPEYSFIALTINKETKNIVDAAYLLSIWLDQYQADFTLTFNKSDYFTVEKITKSRIYSDPMDSLECYDMQYSWVVNNFGDFEETMLKDDYYKCSVPDYEKGLIDETGKRENVIYIIFPNFDVKIPGFYPGEYPPGDNEQLTVDLHEFPQVVDADFSIGGIYGTSGSPFSNVIEIINTGIEYSNLKVEQQYSTTLFFNEDGSGGVYTIGDIGDNTSEWVALKQKDRNKYATLSQQEMSKYKKPVSESDKKRAEEYKRENDVSVTYKEYVDNVKFRISYTAGGENETAVIQFNFQYGD